MLRRTCSIGFSAFPLDPNAVAAPTWELTVELADRCLYGAKASGRDTWVGVIGTLGRAVDLRTRLASDFAGLLRELEVRTSLPDGRPVQWDRQA